MPATLGAGRIAHGLRRRLRLRVRPLRVRHDVLRADWVISFPAPSVFGFGCKMPFYAPYKTQFEDGDLIYGLTPSRWGYRSSNSRFTSAREGSAIYSIDQYRVVCWEMSEAADPAPTPPRRGEFLKVIQDHPKYSSILKTTDDEWSPARFCLDVRRKVKAGLHWAAHDPRNVCVHFILDDIDLAEVVHKSNPSDGDFGLGKERAFTGVELRWIYRNRHNPRVQSCVQFWMDSAPTCPPWDGRYPYSRNASSLWRSYIPRSEPCGGTWSSIIGRILHGLF
jgi:hypothetical protein